MLFQSGATEEPVFATKQTALTTYLLDAPHWKSNKTVRTSWRRNKGTTKDGMNKQIRRGEVLQQGLIT